ncbi:MAG: bifunctional folylpolyglutamate synthase/dihydrofolate synthase [Myxococcales bacterium]|nr:bifunctional folylpolyglutamate synthase/dihydrofolate synthase [Myxococcales bacterium]
MSQTHLWDDAAYQTQLNELFRLRRGAEGRGLDGMRALWDKLGRPGEEIPCIQVAGTNGKGSVCAWLSSMLRACGQHVGLFTSPHLLHFRERFRVDEQDVSDEAIARWLPKILEAAKQTGYPPLFFEIVTALGLCLFAEAGVDWMILEVGLGGRLDPTTVIPSVASVVTSIGLDHCAWLGNSLAQIASEKAGIFRSGVPAWVGFVPEEAEKVIADVAEEKGVSSMSWAGRDFLIKVDGDKARFLGSDGSVEGLSLPLHGVHQPSNLALALAVLMGQKDRGVSWDEDTLRRGVASVRWDGRLQRIEQAGQVFLLDGAHNPEAAEVLARSLEGASVATLIFGAMEDKDVRGTLVPLLKLVPKVVFCTVQSPRACSASSLRAIATELAPDGDYQVADDLTDAIEMARQDAQGTVLIAGSLYLVGEALAAFRGKGTNEA